MFRETPQQYAQRRANETGKAYFVSSLGHAMLDCPMNRKAMREIECSVTVYPPADMHLTALVG